MTGFHFFNVYFLPTLYKLTVESGCSPLCQFSECSLMFATLLVIKFQKKYKEPPIIEICQETERVHVHNDISFPSDF